MVWKGTAYSNKGCTPTFSHSAWKLQESLKKKNGKIEDYASIERSTVSHVFMITWRNEKLDSVPQTERPSMEKEELIETNKRGS